jgi:hypothetical protein
MRFLKGMVMDRNSMSLTACSGIVALLYRLGLIGLRVTILGPLYYTALLHSHPLMEDCQ